MYIYILLYQSNLYATAKYYKKKRKKIFLCDIGSLSEIQVPEIHRLNL